MITVTRAGQHNVSNSYTTNYADFHHKAVKEFALDKIEQDPQFINYVQEHQQKQESKNTGKTPAKILQTYLDNETNRFVEYTAFCMFNGNLIQEMMRIVVEEYLKTALSSYDFKHRTAKNGNEIYWYEMKAGEQGAIEERCKHRAGEAILKNFELRANVSWLYLEQGYRTGWKQENSDARNFSENGFMKQLEESGINHSHKNKVQWTEHTKQHMHGDKQAQPNYKPHALLHHPKEVHKFVDSEENQHDKTRHDNNFMVMAAKASEW